MGVALALVIIAALFCFAMNAASDGALPAINIKYCSIICLVGGPMEISKRTQDLGTETAFEVLAEVNRLRRGGLDIISFCIGQPDFDTPRNIKDAAIKAMDEGKTGYTDSAGTLPARESVARYL